MSDYLIKKSEKYLQFKVIVVSVVAVFLIILTFLILRGTRELLGIEITLFGLILRFLIIVMAFGAIFVTSLRHNEEYVFSGNKLNITKKGIGSKSSRQVINMNPDTVSRVWLNQNFLEKQLNSGTIVIDVDSMSGKSTYKLSDVENPNQVLNEIEKYLK